MSQSIYEATHKDAARSEDPQERNRAWWEALPMTYAEWDSAERVPKTAQDFEAVTRAYLQANPWIAEHVRFADHKDKLVLEIGCGAGRARRARACVPSPSSAMIRLIDERISSIDGSALMSPIALLCPCPEFLPPLLAVRRGRTCG